MPNNKFFLTIDIGNSSSKVVLYEHKQMLCEFPLEKLNHRIDQYDLNDQNTKVLLCSVKKQLPQIALPYQNVKTFFKDQKFLEMPVSYNETLGIDRLVCAYYYYHLNNKSKLIIDAGTFTTIDHVNNKGFNGGFILPGLHLISSNYLYGDQLFEPKLEEVEQLEGLLHQFPQSTQSAINKGSILSFLAPIRQIIESHLENDIIFTGGNAQILYSYFKKQDFCQDASIQYDKSLVNIALLEIMHKVYK